MKTGAAYTDTGPQPDRERMFTIRLSDQGVVEGLVLSTVSECLCELDGNVRRPELAAVSRWNEEESAKYQGLGKVWNSEKKRPRTRAAFLEFLGLEWNYGFRRRKYSIARTHVPSFG